MKLSRLFLLIPMVFTLGCKKQNFKPSDPVEDITVISEEEFNAIFHNYKLFLEDNVVVKTYISHNDEPYYFEADHGDMKFYCEKDSELEQRYIYYYGNQGFDIIAYDKDDTGWFVDQHFNDPAQLKYVLYNEVAFVPFEYKDLVRDEDNKLYRIPSTVVINEMDEKESILFKNVELSFYDKKPTSIKFDFQPVNSPSDAGNGSQTFTYGSAKVVNPK